MLNDARLAQLRRLIDENDWDVLLLYGDGWRKEFMRTLVEMRYSGPHAFAGVTRDGEVFAVFSDPWDFECARAAASGRFEVELSFDPGQALGRRTRAAGRVAVAGLELMEARMVEALGPAPVSATAALERLRMVKTADEIEKLRRAAALADRGYRCFVETVREGLREYELVAEVEAFLKSEGAEDNFMLLSAGGPEIRSMKPPTERPFRAGDCVATELTPQVDGYYAQICRTLVVGEPSPSQLEAFELFRRAQKAAEDILKPGVAVSALAKAENDVFRDAGLGEYTGSSYTRVRGHGLGLFVDEKPSILEDVDTVVEKGMVLIAHPNTYHPGVGYMVFGDALLVTGDGSESLATTERKLFTAAP